MLKKRNYDFPLKNSKSTFKKYVEKRKSCIKNDLPNTIDNYIKHKDSADFENEKFGLNRCFRIISNHSKYDNENDFSIKNFPQNDKGVSEINKHNELRKYPNTITCIIPSPGNIDASSNLIL